MSRTTLRALQIELLRGAAPVAAAATLAAAAGMLYVNAADWAGQWMPFAAAVRSGMFVSGAIAVAVGAWQAGRERRRHITEQLDGIPRPGWQPVLVAWAGVTLGCWLGLLIAVAAGAALVAPVATYWGGGWWWLIAVAFLALAALSALGAAFGRLTPYRLAGPIAAVIFYALILFVQEDAGDDPAEWLIPALRIYESVGSTLPLSLHVQQIAWFGGLAAALLVLAAARRRIFVLIPAAVATAGAVLLTNGSGAAPDPSATSRWEADPAARELVCTDDEVVCLSRAEAFLLDDVAPYAREALARLDGVLGTPKRAEGLTHSRDVVDDSLVYINTRHITITGDLETDEAQRIVTWHLGGCGSIGERLSNLSTAVVHWVDPQPQEWAEPGVREAINALEAMSAVDRQAWLTEFVPAAESCDKETLESLKERL